MLRLLILVALMTSVHQLHAQWKPLRVIPAAHNLTAVSMTSSVRGFAVGEGGTVRVANGETVVAGLPSVQWTTLLEAAPETLLDVVALNEDQAIAVGENGCVVHIQGSSVTRVDVPTTVDLRAVARHGQVVVAGGADGGCIVSSDGGVTWSAFSTGLSEDVNDILADADGVWYIAMPKSLLTSTTTQEWKLVPFPNGCLRLHKLGSVPRSASIPKTALIAFGDPWYFGATNDGGATWHSEFISTPHVNKARTAVLTSAAISSDGLHISMSGLENFMPLSVHVISDDAGISFADHADVQYSRYDLSDQTFATPQRLVGTTMNALCPTYTYVPTLQHWSSPENAGSSMYFKDIDARDGRVVLCGNADEAIVTVSPTYPFSDLRTTQRAEGTKSTDVLLLGDSTVLWLVDSTVNAIVGSDIHTYFFSYVMRSHDNGRTFDQVLMRDDSIALTGMNFFDDKHGIVYGYGRRFYTTSDGGATWTSRTFNDTGVYVSTVGVMHSPSSWQLYCYASATQSYAWYRTTDAGATWTSLPAPFAPLAVFRTSSRRLITCGGNATGVGITRRDAIAVSDDDGLTWTTVMDAENPPGSGGLRSVACIGDRCIAVGDMEKVLYSMNGGITWNPDVTAAHATDELIFLRSAFPSPDVSIVLGVNYAITRELDETVSAHDPNDVGMKSTPDIVIDPSNGSITIQSEHRILDISFIDVLGRCVSMPMQTTHGSHSPTGTRTQVDHAELLKHHSPGWIRVTTDSACYIVPCFIN